MSNEPAELDNQTSVAALEDEILALEATEKSNVHQTLNFMEPEASSIISLHDDPELHEVLENKPEDVTPSLADPVNFEKHQQQHAARQIEKRFAAIRIQNAVIEENLGIAENEVMHKDELAFYMQLHQLSLSNLNEANEDEVNKRIDEHSRALAARIERKKNKREARINNRGAKRRDMIIEIQEKTAHSLVRLRNAISEKRKAFDDTMNHLNYIHEKQRQNLYASQDRNYQNEKMLVDLETRRMSAEVRNTALKKFQVRTNHRAHLNKRINDNLREFQILERQQAKERFELEIVGFEEIGSKRVTHQNQLEKLKLQHFLELNNEKESVLQKNEMKKHAYLIEQQKRQIKKLQYEQRIELRKLDQEFVKKMAQGNIGSTVSSVVSTNNNSRAESNFSSKMSSRVNSNKASAMHSRADSGEAIDNIDYGNMNWATIEPDNEKEREQEDLVIKKGKSMDKSIIELLKRHVENENKLELELNQDLNKSMLANESKLEEMIENHSTACALLATEQERQLNLLKEVQEKEIKYEETMHDNEMNMLIERRILNSVLNTVSDGIICITPLGKIIRFNHAAELLFEYTANEVLGKNIKMLVPPEHAVNHDQYLNNYLTSGIKKVIGIGRKVRGLKKSGVEFPFYLSLSEVKEHGEHMFTGIVHDLTQEDKLKAENKAKDDAKNQELRNVVELLDVENIRISALLQSILPPSVSKALMEGQLVKPEIFESTTICYFDIVGFTTIASQVEPLEIVTLLNDLYNRIDNVIELYDAYKVETVGDCYMIASGVPNRNTTHAFEICKMAVHLIQTVKEFVYEPNPEIKIRIRVGIHSGIVVGGVVGDKMPRYCLFGDTVLNANKMEQTSEPLRIQMSEATYAHVSQDKNFRLEPRGSVKLVGGQMKTFWLNSIKDFNPEEIVQTK